jgi:hypothetical protein
MSLSEHLPHRIAQYRRTSNHHVVEIDDERDLYIRSAGDYAP